MMKLEILAATALVSTYAAPVKAENPHVRRLLETRECAGCDLTKANLGGAHLVVLTWDANLKMLT